jgi:hypothetical protein
MKQLIPLTIYLTEEELDMLLDQTRRDNELNRRHLGKRLAPELRILPHAVASTALVQWLRKRAEREKGAP